VLAMGAEQVLATLVQLAGVVTMRAPALAELGPEKRSQPAVLAVVVEPEARARCHMWAVGRASTCRRPPTSMSALAVILRLLAPGETSPA